MSEQELYLRHHDNTVISAVKNPTVLYEKDTFVVHKVGDYDMVMQAYHKFYGSYQEAGLQYMAEDLVVMELPKDQTIIDNVLQNTGYLKRFLQSSSVQ